MSWEFERDALIEVATALAPDRPTIAHAVMDRVSADSGKPYQLARARMVLVDQLDDAGLVALINYRDGSEYIAGRLQQLSTYPTAMAWDWYEHFLRDLPDLKGGMKRFLELVGEHSYAVGSALVNIDTGSDAGALAFVPTEQVSGIVERARHSLSLIRLGTMTAIQDDVPAFPQLQAPDVVCTALPQLAEILAPNRPDIMELLRLVLDDPRAYLDAYPAMDYLCSGEGDLARRGLLAMLHGTDWGISPALLEYFDWRDDIETIREQLGRLCPPELSSLWSAEYGSAINIADPQDRVTETSTFLKETGDQFHRLGFALVSITVGDGYHLGLCQAADAERAVRLLLSAGYDAAETLGTTTRPTPDVNAP
ncbi:hypothetical protein ACIRRA_28360 [Nocardia sp. NPDC101769]|uniref:DUF6630 family protein n=1 Tax=Nocardia sp. NPDC101769 TaxID=3364333 RepID=UPI00380B0D65